MNDKEEMFYQACINGDIKIIEPQESSIKIDYDEIIELQKCGITLESDMEAVAELESNLQEA